MLPPGSFNGFLILLASVSCIVLTATVDQISNPIGDWINCGRPKSSFVCDPDGLIPTDEANQLDTILLSIYHNTSCPCGVNSCSKENVGYRVGVAVVGRMQQNPSVQSSLNSPSAMAKEMDSALQMAQIYATSLLSKWQLSRCGDGVLVFYSKNDSVYYTATDPVAGSLLTSGIIGEISLNARQYFAVNITTGLQSLLYGYRSVFMGTYNRTTRWQFASGQDPKTEKVVAGNGASAVTSTLLKPAVLVFLTMVLNASRL